MKKEDLPIIKYFFRIPDVFFEKMSFVLILSLILSLPITFFVRIFSIYNILVDLIFSIGTLLQILTVVYVIRQLLLNGFSKIKLDVWDKMLLGVLIFAIISAFLATDKELAFWGTLYRNEGLTMYLTYASIYICCKTIKKLQKKRILLFVFCFSIALLSIMTQIQASPTLISALGEIGQHLSADGPGIVVFASIFFNTNHYAYILTLAILGFAGLFALTNGWLQYLSLALFSFNLCALIVNKTFGSYLAVFVGLVFLALILFLRDRKLLRNGIILISLFITLSIVCDLNGIGIISDDFSTLQNDVSNSFKDDNSTSRRIALWKQAFEFILQKPVFGHGPEGLHHLYYSSGFDNDRPHNEYIQMAAFHGIPALCMYLGSLASLLVFCLENLKKLPKEFIVLGGMVFAYCASAFFGNTMYYTTPYFIIFLALLSTCKSSIID